MIAFPANPSVNDTYTASGRTWKWTGTVWQLQPRTLTSADITDFAEAVGAAAPPTTDASLLTSGTLADARLSAAVTASLALADTASQPGHRHTLYTEIQDALLEDPPSALNDIGAQPAGNYATLVNGTVPADQLPSYVDDVLEFADLAAFPEVGETGKIYTAIDTRKIYRWSGSVYIEISPSEVTSVAGKTGAVTLAKADVGLGNVDNTSDLNKPISTATQTALNNKLSTNTPGVLEVNSSSPALRITQTGTGNALVVEDSTHPDATPFFIDNLGNMHLIGNDVPIRISSPLNSHNGIGVSFQINSGALGTWNILQDPSANGGTNLAILRALEFNNSQWRSAPRVFDLRQTGNHTAGDNWEFTGDVTVAGTVTNTGLANAIADRQPLTVYSDTAPAHTPGLEWVDTTDLRSYRSYNGLWVEIDRA